MKTKITSILFLLLLSMFGGRLFAQVLLNTPPSYQPATLVQGAAPGTFKVDIVNNNASVLSGATLTLALPAGVEYVAGSVNAATQTNITNLQSPIFTLSSIPVGNTLTVTFDARINCGFTTGTTIGYTVKNGSTTVATSSSAVSANTPLPAYVLLGVPAPQVLSTTLNTNALRTVKFKNSGNIAVNTVYIESTVATASHASSYKVMSADHGTVSSVTNGYRVTLTGAALQSAISATVGAANTSFDPGEEITVVLTEQIVSCAVTTNIPLNFKAGSGDTKGSFCFSDGSTASISAVVGNQSISLARVPSTTTYPTFCTTGKTSYVITNGGTGNTESALHDIKLPWSVYRSNSFLIGSAPPDGITIKKVSIGGVDITAQVLMKNGTGSGALVPAAQDLYIINLAGLTSAPGTSPLVDLDGDGHFDDLMPGKTVRLDFEYGFNPDTFQSCLLQSATSTTDTNGYFNLGTSYKTQCGAVVNKNDYSYTVSGLTDASQPAFLITTQSVNTNTATIDKALMNVGDKSTISLTMLMNESGALYWSGIQITKSFTIVIPDGLDYDPTGILKYSSTVIPSSAINYTGKTLTVTLSSATYGTVRGNDYLYIPVVATSNVVNNKTINFKATYSQNSCPGILRDYGCGSAALNYGFVTNCPTINTTNFTATRTTFGYVPDVSGNNVYYRPTDFVNENTPGINLQGAVSKDKIRFDLTSVVNSTNFSQLWARIQYTPVEIAANLSHFDPLSTTASTVIGTLTVKKASDASILTTNITVGDVAFSYDAANSLQLMQVNVGSKIGPGLAINYTPVVGDQILINWEVRASRLNLPYAYSAISNLQGDFYTKDAGGVASTCTPLPGILYLERLNLLQTNYYGSLNIAGNQTLEVQMGITNGIYITNSSADKFPNEVRMYANMRKMVATVPGTWVRDTKAPYCFSSNSGNVNLDPSLFTISYTNGNTIISFTNPAFGADGFPSPSSSILAHDYVANNGVERVVIPMKPVCVPAGAISVKNDTNEDIYTGTQETGIVENLNIGGFTTGGINYVNYTANAAPTLQNVDGIGSTVNWQVKVTNTTNIPAMTATGLSADLPNNWMSFESPNNNITVTKLTDIATGTVYPAVSYGTGKYWVKLGSIATTATFNVEATYTTCTDDKLLYTYSFGASGYPIDPLQGYGADVATCTSSQSTFDLNLKPKDVAIGMLLISPVSPVQFCTNETAGENKINYSMTVTNTATGNAEGLVMEASFPDGYGARAGTSKLTYNGVTKTISNPVYNSTKGVWQWNISTDPNGIPYLPGAR